jgi:hypothetical protein
MIKSIKRLLLMQYILGLISVDSFAQSISENEISFKAKLLTVNRLGVASEKAIIEDIKSQQLEFLKNDSGNMIIMKIKFSQSNFKGDDRKVVWLGECNYYIAYNREKFRFYLLGGFSSLDLKTFFEDLNSKEFVDIASNDHLSKEINFQCLYDCSKMSKNKALKSKRFPCLKNCDDELYEYLKSCDTNR